MGGMCVCVGAFDLVTGPPFVDAAAFERNFGGLDFHGLSSSLRNDDDDERDHLLTHAGNARECKCRTDNKQLMGDYRGKGWALYYRQMTLVKGGLYTRKKKKEHDFGLFKIF